ncbi:transcriptional regulator, AraC family [Candidatus Moduliflexus flocculans]|uniref:Transcriptional regulator, AraC family n=1 Tax=Candidatus Moduliflexus flocculans TaxID=1499966 RepID=A0A0S6W1J7_9BACT|nr:transcriptional regulator, AraC family [Candidatus Moduliflexus flocculans]
MEFSTKGKIHYPLFEMPLYYQPHEKFVEIPPPRRYRLVVIHSGSGILSLNGKQYAVIAPALGCLNEATMVELEGTSQFRAEAMYFHPSVINSRLTFANINIGCSEFLQTDYNDANSLLPFRHDEQRGWLHNIGPMTTQRVQELMKTLKEQLETQNTFWPCRARSYLMEFIFLVYELYIAEFGTAESGEKKPPFAEPELPIPASSEEIYPILVYLLNHYHQKITLADLTRIFHTNRSTLNQKFKSATGYSVIDYLIQLRVRMACQLLKDTELAVSEISDRIGYIDLTHFGRIFRKYTQLSPSAYREKFQHDVYPAAYPEN